jgi:hypothetical protein
MHNEDEENLQGIECLWSVTRRKVENNKWGREQQFASWLHCCDRNTRVFNLHQDQVNWEHTGMENWGDHQFNDAFLNFDKLHTTVVTLVCTYEKRLESAE